jgi:hypothetical protein
MESRLRNEAADIDAWLKNGLETCDQFWVDRLLWWDYLEGWSKSIADCLNLDKNFELGKI